MNVSAAIEQKSVTMDATPRKMPLKNSTNLAATLLKSAGKQANGSEKTQLQQRSDDLPTTSEPKESEFDFEPFTFPADKNCYCCGEDRVTDGTVWGQQLAISEDFMNKILSFPDRFEEESFDSPPSPLPTPKRIEIFEPVEEPRFDFRLNNNSYEGFQVNEDDDDVMDVPDVDEFSIVEDW